MEKVMKKNIIFVTIFVGYIIMVTSGAEMYPRRRTSRWRELLRDLVILCQQT